MRIRTRWSPMLIILPMVALGLSLVLWGRNNAVEGGESYRSDDRRPSAHNDSWTDVATGAAHPNNAALHGFHRGNAVTCFTDPKVTLCYQLMKERG